jgi:Pyruvate/2-oxoacid:ferredoxin oxidoreductase delta subunit
MSAGMSAGTSTGTSTAVASLPYPTTAPVEVTSRCAGCGACLLTCPQRAIRPAGGALLVLAEACDGCGECIEVCPVDAIAEVPRARTAHAETADSPSGGPR